MTARILTIDIETQRAVVESFDLWPKYIAIDRIVTPSRILCFAAKYHDEDDVHFHSSWEDGDEKSYRAMIGAAWDLLDSADVVCTWNGVRFDEQWFNAEFIRLGFTPPSPYRALDLFQVSKKKFKAGLLSLKLDWSAKRLLGDRKKSHEGIDLWHEIRYGNKTQQRNAQKLMQEYCIKDTAITDRLIDKFLPWTGMNFALYDSDADDGKPRCTKCASENLHKRGFFYTTAFSYQRYRCADCGSWSRGKRMVYSTELRPA